MVSGAADAGDGTGTESGLGFSTAGFDDDTAGVSIFGFVGAEDADERADANTPIGFCDSNAGDGGGGAGGSAETVATDAVITDASSVVVAEFEGSESEVPQKSAIELYGRRGEGWRRR